MKTMPPFLHLCSYRKSNINTSVECVKMIEMVKILKTELPTSHTKIFEKCQTKIIKNPREKELFLTHLHSQLHIY